MLYPYCPQCTHKLEKKAERLAVCPSCRFHLYDNPRPTVEAIILNEKDEILLIKRGHAPHKNSWDIPGGFVDSGESGEEALKRELKEELNVIIDSHRYFGSYDDLYPFQGDTYHTLALIYVVTIGNSTVTAGDDAVEARFFPKDTLPFEEIGFISVKQILRDFLSSPQKA